MLVHAHIDPGLLIYDGLESHQLSIAFRLLRSLMLHKKMIDESGAQIPVTYDYLMRVYTGLGQIKIKNPPLEKELRSYIVELLGHRATKPALSATKVKRLSLVPDVSNDWIDEETKELWQDCVASSTYEMLTSQYDDKGGIHPTLATWPRENFALEVICTCPELCQCLDMDMETKWIFPVLSSQQDWDEFQTEFLPWPEGLSTGRIEKYARKNLGIPIDHLSRRLEIEFTASCYRDISRESDPEIRNAIIEVIACRAYNRLRPDHGDETISGGRRRVYVKKMAPPVRLHYSLEDNKAIFEMYSIRDHDKGL